MSTADPDGMMFDPFVTGQDSASAARDYEVPRGTCPSCGSTEVVHLVIGMPADPDEWGSGPDWVEWVGCVHPGHDRRCSACGNLWSADHATEGWFVDLGSLMAAAGAITLEELGDWISEDYELDAEALVEDGVLHVRFGTHGAGIEFPVETEAFWALLEEVHAEACVELESDDE